MKMSLPKKLNDMFQIQIKNKIQFYHAFLILNNTNISKFKFFAKTFLEKNEKKVKNIGLNKKKYFQTKKKKLNFLAFYSNIQKKQSYKKNIKSDNV